MGKDKKDTFGQGYVGSLDIFETFNILKAYLLIPKYLFPISINICKAIPLGTFGRADVPQRLINQSLYQEIILLQKFSDISGKVLKPKKKSASNLKKIKNGLNFFFWGWRLFFFGFKTIPEMSLNFF